ncbi:MAG: 16S rRNA (adenine(1518)-N(6)/adenine(1519)-N(6))-dimethyltransferase RsmA [Pseudomonadota bacterium]
MTSPRQFVRETGFRPKRAWGQNFLIHEESAEKIVAWAGVREGDTVLEIGPGLGALTNALGRVGCFVVAIEKDPTLAAALRRRFTDAPWLTLIEGDALTLDARTVRKPLARLRVVANLPYSVSTPILESLLARLDCFEDLVLLFQEEVADRICAEPGISDYGRLTIWVQALCEAERGPKVTKGSFYPEPDVQSRLVRLTPRCEPLVPRGEIDFFLETVALLFQHRRKTVRNSLRDARRREWNVEGALSRARIEPTRRPETLSIPELRALALHLNVPPD